VGATCQHYKNRQKSKTLKYIRISVIFIIVISIIVPSILACNIPVFRYALERWPAGQFRIDVFYNGKLTIEDETAIKRLTSVSYKSGGISNLLVRTVDISLDKNRYSLEFIESLDNAELPLLTVRYPDENLINKVIWSERLTTEAVDALVNSPIRRELVRRILDGESATWILLESGDSKRDDSAAEIFESNLSQMPGCLMLPSLDPLLPADQLFSAEEMAKLYVDFSLLRLSRDDPQELIFVQMLLNSEPDLAEYVSEPIAFPVYGRGRILYALVGGGINRVNILEACAFLTEACSCEIKAENPGVDLLISVDWDAGIEKSTITKMELPSLVSLSELVREAVASEIEPATEIVDPEPASTTPDSLEQSIVVPSSGNRSSGTSGSESTIESAWQSTSVKSATDVVTAEITNDVHRNIFISIATLLVIVIILSLKMISGKPGEGK